MITISLKILGTSFYSVPVSFPLLAFMQEDNSPLDEGCKYSVLRNDKSALKQAKFNAKKSWILLSLRKMEINVVLFSFAGCTPEKLLCCPSNSSLFVSRKEGQGA